MATAQFYQSDVILYVATSHSITLSAILVVCRSIFPTIYKNEMRNEALRICEALVICHSLPYIQNVYSLKELALIVINRLQIRVGLDIEKAGA